MRESSKTLFGLGAAWVVLTVLSALVVYASAGTLWEAAHRPEVAVVVWPTLAIVVLSGATLLAVVHVHLLLSFGERGEE